MRLVTLSGVLVVLLSALTVGQTPPDCWDCHRDKLDRAAFESSVHNDLACTDCHSDAQSVPHEQRPRRPSPQVCAGCHPAKPPSTNRAFMGALVPRGSARPLTAPTATLPTQSSRRPIHARASSSAICPRPADAATKIRESRSASASPRAATPHILRAITASPSNMGASSPPTVPVATGAISS
jgi:predicted CXXCH cytochrome family protein